MFAFGTAIGAILSFFPKTKNSATPLNIKLGTIDKETKWRFSDIHYICHQHTSWSSGACGRNVSCTRNFRLDAKIVNFCVEIVFNGNMYILYGEKFSGILCQWIKDDKFNVWRTDCNLIPLIPPQGAESSSN